MTNQPIVTPAADQLLMWAMLGMEANGLLNGAEAREHFTKLLAETRDHHRHEAAEQQRAERAAFDQHQIDKWGSLDHEDELMSAAWREAADLIDPKVTP